MVTPRRGTVLNWGNKLQYNIPDDIQESNLELNFDCGQPGVCQLELLFTPEEMRSDELPQLLVMSFSVPFYVHVFEDGEGFEKALANLQCATQKEKVLDFAKATLEHTLRDAHIRFVWGVNGKEQLPDHLREEENYKKFVTRVHLNDVYAYFKFKDMLNNDIKDVVNKFIEKYNKNRSDNIALNIVRLGANVLNSVKETIDYSKKIGGFAHALNFTIMAGDDIQVFSDILENWQHVRELARCYLERRKMYRPPLPYEDEPLWNDMSKDERFWTEQQADFLGRVFAFLIGHELMHNVIGHHTDLGAGDILNTNPSMQSVEDAALYLAGISISDMDKFPADGFSDTFGTIRMLEIRDKEIKNLDVPGMAHILPKNLEVLKDRLHKEGIYGSSV
jgi:hypothetical protein